VCAPHSSAVSSAPLQGLRLGTNAWLARWSSQASGSGGGGRPLGVGVFAGVYVGLGFGYAAAVFARSTTNNLGCGGALSRVAVTVVSTRALVVKGWRKGRLRFAAHIVLRAAFAWGGGGCSRKTGEPQAPRAVVCQGIEGVVTRTGSQWSTDRGPESKEKQGIPAFLPSKGPFSQLPHPPFRPCAPLRSSYSAGRVVFASALSALLAAPLSFFEATPIGR
jgi:hypothetical protein